jgi:hypothetical protein
MAFADEAVDPEWQAKKRKELTESLAAIENELASAQIDCRSTICRVELVARNAESPQDQARRLAAWGEEVRRRGFVRMDSEFFPNGTTSLSFLSSRPIPTEAQLPPEFPPEVVESFRKGMQAGVGRGDSGTEPSMSPQTWTGSK